MLLASTFSDGRKIALDDREGIHLLCFDGGVGLRQADRQFRPLWARRRLVTRRKYT
jgi:hypothetical protein